MYRSALTLLALILLALPQPVTAEGWREIAPKRVHDLLKEGSGLWLIDVSVPAAFERSHIEGAVNIPSAELRYKRFPKQKILVVTDNSLGDLGARAAAESLVKSGHERVFVLAGGMNAWRRAGFPVVGEAAGPLRVMPAELDAARAAGIPLRLLDLRPETERSLGEVAGAEAVEGKDLEIMLAKVRRTLEREAQESKKNLAKKLRPAGTTVLLLPIGADAATLVQTELWGLAADVRYVEGGYLAAAPRRTRTSSNIDGCATCPGN